MADVTISGLNPTVIPQRGGVVPYSDGSTTTKLTISQIADLIVPIGSIIMWSGSIATIPSNWALCDGNNTTPDLRDRFVVGAGRQYSVTNIGGLSAVTLTEAQMPAHNHSFTFNTLQYGGHAGSSQYYFVDTATSTGTTSTKGSGTAHENRPPYYALAFIMRIS